MASKRFHPLKPKLRVNKPGAGTMTKQIRRNVKRIKRGR